MPWFSFTGISVLFRRKRIWWNGERNWITRSRTLRRKSGTLFLWVCLSVCLCVHLSACMSVGLLCVISVCHSEIKVSTRSTHPMPPVLVLKVGGGAIPCSRYPQTHSWFSTPQWDSFIHSFIFVEKHDDKTHHERTSIRNLHWKSDSESNKVNIHLCTAYEQ